MIDLTDPTDADWFNEGREDAGERGLSDASDRSLIDDTTPDFDAHYLRLLEGHAWHPDTDRALIADTGVPEAVQARLREAILGGALFSDFDTIPSDDLAALRQEFVDMLDAEGWTTDSLTEQLQDFEPSLSDAEAERIARTETASVVNTAREEAYEDRGLEDDRFKWVGTEDRRTTEACTWLKDQTNPDHGGTPVTLERLQELVAEAPTHDADMQDDLARPDNYVVHPNERHTYVRHVE